jgi:hypothetical protein
MAKAIASGDPRLMQKAGIEAELARLERLRAAHVDEQYALRCRLDSAKKQAALAERRIAGIEQDIAQRIDTRGEAFAMIVEGETFLERKSAGLSLLKAIRFHEVQGTKGEWRIGEIGGFPIFQEVFAHNKFVMRIELTLQRNNFAAEIDYKHDLSPLGVIARLESILGRFEIELIEQKRIAAESADRIAIYAQRIGTRFAYEDELSDKRAEMAALDASLKATEAA